MAGSRLRRGGSGNRTMMIAHSLPRGGGGYARTDHDAGNWRRPFTGAHRPGRNSSKPTTWSLPGFRMADSRLSGPSTEALDCFRGRYAPRSPQLPSDDPHQDIQLGADLGFRLLGPAPAVDVSFGSPPASRSDAGSNRYLWVIDERGIPFVLESRLAAVGSNLPKHTNLTGGGRAYLGGEMWFDSPVALYVSGGSGRYPPWDHRQLEAAVQVFASFGYEAGSLGWDHVARRAKRYREGPPWPV